MKKFVFCTLLCILFFSCSSIDDTPPSTCSEQSINNGSKTIERILSINDSLSIIKGTRNSRGFLKGMLLVSADAYGAYEIGKIGSIAGATAGSFFGGVGAGPGAIVGGVIGGAIGGIGASYGAYLTYKGCGIESSTIENVTSAFCAIRGNMMSSDNSIPVFVLDIPDEFNEAEEIAMIHNLTLDKLININYDIELFSDDLSYPENEQLSEIELFILQSPDFIDAYYEAMSSISIGCYQLCDYTTSVSDQVMKLYVEALENYLDNTDSYDNILNLTNLYIETISNSDELSETEKLNLFVSLSVGLYSYNYWSAKYYETDY